MLPLNGHGVSKTELSSERGHRSIHTHITGVRERRKDTKVKQIKFGGYFKGLGLLYVFACKNV